jgi:hypothetical protein
MKKYKVVAIVEAENKVEALLKAVRPESIKVKRVKEKQAPIEERVNLNCRCHMTWEHIEEPEPRCWVPVEEREKKKCEHVWGLSDGEDVHEWFFSHHHCMWLTTGDGQEHLSWDMSHQPTHIMPMVEGEEPPAPPTREQLLIGHLAKFVKEIEENNK